MSSLLQGMLAVLVLGSAVCSAIVSAAEDQKAAASSTENIIATGAYKDLANESGLYKLPEGLKWVVEDKYRSTDPTKDDPRLTLILRDTERRFYPVISKMDLVTAKKLRDDLAKEIERREKETAAADRK
jgi:hypothetical protein